MKKIPFNVTASCALISAAVAVGSSSHTQVIGADCATRQCEIRAPYTLKIFPVIDAVVTAANDSQSHKVDANIPPVKSTGEAGEVAVGETNRAGSRAANDETIDKTHSSQPVTTSTVAGSGRFSVTRNPDVIEPYLGLKVASSATVIDGSLEKPHAVSISTNYTAFLDKWELRITPVGSPVNSQALYKRQGRFSGNVTELAWHGEFSDSELRNMALTVGSEYDFSIRVYDKAGNFDQTVPTTVRLVAAEAGRAATRNQRIKKLAVAALDDSVEERRDNYARQSIALNGSTVTLRARDLNDIKSVAVNGQNVAISNSELSVDYILPAGKHHFDVSTTDHDGGQTSEEVAVDVKADHFFMVGLADVTVGRNSISGSIESLAADKHHYGGDLFVDGRLAFYLKGKVRGKYLLTAQMDTGTDDVSELFKNLHKKDPENVFRRIDPDQYYLVYGDDSLVRSDTDSQGKIFVRLDWDKSHALWGNFNTAFSGTEYVSYNRSLYGAQYVSRSTDTTAQGDTKTELSAFVSEVQTRVGYNEFIGTGGSLYYLRDQDIVPGSEKLRIEVRRNNSEQVIQRVPMVRGRDYEIDEFQGRIILTRPLLSVSAGSGPSLIRDEPDLDENTYLVVDYEYIPDGFSSSDVSAGARARHWINDNIAVGATVTQESENASDHRIQGVDVTVKKSDQTYLRYEIAQSQSTRHSDSFQSQDGGLTFTSFDRLSADGERTTGLARSVEARIHANEFIDLSRPVTVTGWIKHRQAGFSGASIDTTVDTRDMGLEAQAELSRALSVSARATRVEKEGQSNESIAAVQADYRLSDRLTVSGELRGVSLESLTNGTEQSATLAAGKLDAEVTESVSVYGIAQGTMSRRGGYQRNNLLTTGVKARVNDRLTLNAEASTGDRGNNLSIGAEHNTSATYSVYASADIQRDNGTPGQSLTLGQRKTLSDTLKVYTEHQFSTHSGSDQTSNTVGLNNNFSRHTSGSLSFQSSRIEGQDDTVINRNTLSAALSYKHDHSTLSSKLEYREDQSEDVETNQWVFINDIQYRQSENARWQGRLNYSSTRDDAETEDAEFVEAGIGFAYRPVASDRFNLLARYTAVKDLPPNSQSERNDKRLSVLSVENSFDFTPQHQLGAKLAYRKGETRTDRDTGNWVDNDARLAAVRYRYRTLVGLNAMASYQWLASDATDSVQNGALVSFGFNVKNHLQFSIGYNFTSFNDNLTDDDYDVQGWFLNLTGKY